MMAHIELVEDDSLQKRWENTPQEEKDRIASMSSKEFAKLMGEIGFRNKATYVLDGDRALESVDIDVLDGMIAELESMEE